MDMSGVKHSFYATVNLVESAIRDMQPKEMKAKIVPDGHGGKKEIAEPITTSSGPVGNLLKDIVSRTATEVMKNVFPFAGKAEQALKQQIVADNSLEKIMIVDDPIYGKKIIVVPLDPKHIVG